MPQFIQSGTDIFQVDEAQKQLRRVSDVPQGQNILSSPIKLQGGRVVGSGGITGRQAQFFGFNVAEPATTPTTAPTPTTEPTQTQQQSGFVLDPGAVFTPTQVSQAKSAIFNTLGGNPGEATTNQIITNLAQAGVRPEDIAGLGSAVIQSARQGVDAAKTAVNNVRATQQAQTPTGQAPTITVQSGDTASGIARQAGLSLDQLLELNPSLRANPNLIFPGQQIFTGGVPTVGGVATDPTQTGTPAAFTPTATIPPEATQAGQSLLDAFNAPNKKIQDVLDEIDILRSGILGTITGTTQESILREEFARFGVEDKLNSLSELDKQITEQTQRLEDLPDNVRKGLQDAGVTQGQLDRLILKESETPSKLLRGIMTERNALASDINRAMSFAEKFTDARIADQATKVAAFEFELESAVGDLKDLEASQKSILKAANDERKEILEIAQDAIDNGADQEAVDQILKAKSIEEALQNSVGFTADDVLSVNEASRLRVPFGTTRQEAIAMGRVPERGTIAVPSDFTAQEQRDTLGLGIDIFNTDFRRTLLSTLSNAKISEFMTDYNAAVQESSGRQSIDPTTFFNAWLDAERVSKNGNAAFEQWLKGDI